MNLPTVPAQAQMLSKGVFEHHTNTDNPLVAGYPNPMNSTAQAQLDALLSTPYVSGVQNNEDSL